MESVDKLTHFKDGYDHYFDDRLYLIEMQVLVNQNFSQIIKIPYMHKSTWGNGDYHLHLFCETFDQLKLLYRHNQPGLRIQPHRLEKEFKKINYDVAKYSLEKLCRFYKNVEADINGKPFEFF